MLRAIGGNARSWGGLCGTQFAESLSVEDESPASLKTFDDWCSDFYTYVDRYIPFFDVKDKDAVEIGLGYETVSQRVLESGARYRGLDIAAGSVNMVNTGFTPKDCRAPRSKGPRWRIRWTMGLSTTSLRSGACITRVT